MDDVLFMQIYEDMLRKYKIRNLACDDLYKFAKDLYELGFNEGTMSNDEDII